MESGVLNTKSGYLIELYGILYWAGEGIDSAICQSWQDDFDSVTSCPVTTWL